MGLRVPLEAQRATTAPQQGPELNGIWLVPKEGNGARTELDLNVHFTFCSMCKELGQDGTHGPC